MTYRDLIEKRKSCPKCQNCGLCKDLTQKDSKGMLFQLEIAFPIPFSIDSLGLWDPLNNSNPLTASILIIGQDFSHARYFDDVKSLSEVIQKESNNATNKNLIRYLGSIDGFDRKEIYFANAVLCIKSGSMNAPIKRKWLTNCSDNFLKPLIIEHLNNLKIIITLGKVALDAIRVISEDAATVISDFCEKDSFSSLPGNKFEINIDNKPLILYPMFHPGRLGASNASRVKKKPEDLWKSILCN
jgi:uracil-DNA glycosylase